MHKKSLDPALSMLTLTGFAGYCSNVVGTDVTFWGCCCMNLPYFKINKNQSKHGNFRRIWKIPAKFKYEKLIYPQKSINGNYLSHVTFRSIN